jgi:FMN phosphatase YigB (HAD superfamily)
MPERVPVVVLFDVDNTLLEHDRVVRDLRKHLTAQFGKEREELYWSIFEELREEVGYADYLGALQKYRLQHPHDAGFLEMSLYLLNYPFANRLYPGALDAVEKAAQWGKTVILTDGDVVFQPRKIERSGLLEAFEGRVLIYIHKEFELANVEARYPADHYILVDDKLRILTAVKKIWGTRVTTVFPRQGHYAFDPKVLESNPPADITIESIRDLENFDVDQVLSAAKPSPNS